MKSEPAANQRIHPVVEYPLDNGTEAEKAWRLIERISAGISKRREVLANNGMHQMADSYSGFLEDIIFLAGFMPDRKRLTSLPRSPLTRSERFLINSHRQGISYGSSGLADSIEQYAINALGCRDRAIKAFRNRRGETAVIEGFRAAYWAGRIDERTQVNAGGRRRRRQQIPYDEITNAAEAFSRVPKNRNRRPDAKGVYDLLPQARRPQMSVFLEWFTDWKRWRKSIDSQKKTLGKSSPESVRL